ncbi:MAG: hypothetical protein GXO70_02950 [Acidobacteria bacterium]|nr:hypothetical protein [Acidobacteriota bacterium]
MDWRKLISDEINGFADGVVSLKLKKGMVRYSSRIRQNIPIHRISEDSEIVRAYLVYRFVNKMGYSPESLELDRPYKVGDAGETVTVDVVVNEEDGNPFFFADAVAPDDFGQGGDAESMLFLAAEKEFEQTGKVVRHLFYFTVKIENERLAHDSIIIDYSHFHRLSDWDRTEETQPKSIVIKSDRFWVSRRKRCLVKMGYLNHQFTVFFEL